MSYSQILPKSIVTKLMIMSALILFAVASMMVGHYILSRHVANTITTVVEVIEKTDENKHIRLKTTCTNQDDKVVLDGEALVTIMEL